jgi:anti-sigma factor RsiW
MLCEDVVPELPAFLDGELAPADREAIASHLAGCAACEAERASIARMIERVRALPRAAAPLALAGAVSNAVSRLPAVPSAAPLGESAGPRATCGSIEAAELSAFLDGELPEADRDRTREHVAVCPICAETLVWLDDVSGRVRVLPRVSAPANLIAIVLARIDDLIGRAAPPVARLVAPPSSSRRPGRPWLRGGAPRTAEPFAAEPFEIPQGVKRFLAAASVLVLALGSLAVATPDTSGAVLDQGVPPTVYPHHPIEEVAVVDGVGPSVPAPDPDRLMTVACENPDTAVAAFYAFGATSNVRVFATNQARTLGLTGSAQDLRPALKRLPESCVLEDPARAFVDLVPQPLDQVYTRSGEVLQGIVERQTANDVVLATVVRGSGTEPVTTPTTRGTGLLASYWEIPEEAGEIGSVGDAFRAVEGRAALVRTDATIDFATPGSGPGSLNFNLPFAQTERIAARWQGYVNAERAGRYVFTVNSDDGAVLEIDKLTVVNADGRHGPTDYGGAIDLTRGLHAIELRYFNGGGPGGCRLSYTPPGGGTGVVPQGMLYDPDRIEAGRRALTLAIPRRSVVRVKPASHEPVTVYVLLRRRSE